MNRTERRRHKALHKSFLRKGKEVTVMQAGQEAGFDRATMEEAIRLAKARGEVIEVNGRLMLTDIPNPGKDRVRQAKK